MRKYVGFGRLYGIVRDIFNVPETVCLIAWKVG